MVNAVMVNEAMANAAMANAVMANAARAGTHAKNGNLNGNLNGSRNSNLNNRPNASPIGNRSSVRRGPASRGLADTINRPGPLSISPITPGIRTAATYPPSCCGR